MQQEMIKEIESSRPTFIVFVNVYTSWLARRQSDHTIFEWFDAYTRQQYHLDGIVDILSLKHSEYKWGSDAQGYSPQSSSFVSVYKRNP